MSYVALYRKFRPQTFDQVKGQDHVVRTLTNQIKNDRIGHAYLFTGTRGTGKTSVAKLFAKAINCQSPVNGEPCNACENCRSAAQGNFIDVVEIDAASNTGVDDIRRIIEEVQYTPVKGRYKVYIIDEVHMLSNSAFNAFLKTLEEPPAYAVFILATTEPHKLPITILSRCQRYDFKRIGVDTIADNLAGLTAQESVEADEKALKYIARIGDGSMRDSISLLDKCIAFNLGEKLTYDNVLATLGAVDIEIFSGLFRAVSASDAAAAVGFVDAAVEEGKDLGQFTSDFVWYLRNLLLTAVSAGTSEIPGISSENMRLLKEDAASADAAVLMRYIRILSELMNQLRFSSAKQILTEVAVIKLAKPQMETDTESMLDRIRQLEQRPAGQGAPVMAGTPAAQSAPAAPRASAAPSGTPAVSDAPPTAFYADEEEYAPQPFIEYVPEPSAAYAPESPAEYVPDEPAAPAVFSGSPAQQVCDHWKEVLAALGSKRMEVILGKLRLAALDEQNLVVYVPQGNSLAAGTLKDPETLEKIKAKAREMTGSTIAVTAKQEDDIDAFLRKNINIEIGMEES